MHNYSFINPKNPRSRQLLPIKKIVEFSNGWSNRVQFVTSVLTHRSPSTPHSILSQNVLNTQPHRRCVYATHIKTFHVPGTRMRVMTPWCPVACRGCASVCFESTDANPMESGLIHCHQMVYYNKITM